MGKTNGQGGIEAIAVRRALLADADKVRYRVYRTPDDFIAVIAESALMAVKVAGIATPYRIVRDLPSEGVTIKADRLAKQEAVYEQVALATQRKEKNPPSSSAATKENGTPFVPLQLRDLDKARKRRIRILAPGELDAAPTPAKVPEAPPPPPPPPKAAEPPPKPQVVAEQIPESDTLSPEEVARLLT